MILSLEKADPYLHRIGFPLDHKSKELEEAAKNFVLSQHEVQSHDSYTVWHTSGKGRKLFGDIYDTLIRQIGNENTETVCSWGNHLHISGDIAYSLGIYERLLYALGPDDAALKLDLPKLSSATLEWLLSEIQQYRREGRETDLALDTLDATPKSDWEDWVYSILNVNEPFDAPKISPYDFLASLIYNVNRKYLLKKIESRLSKEALVAFENWLNSQVLWVQAQSKAIYPHYYQLFSLTELYKIFD